MDWELLGAHADEGYLVLKKEDYFTDFRQSEEDTFTQLCCDVPRADVRVGVVRITDGELLWEMLFSWLSPCTALDFSRLCTQTALALPMREIHTAMPSGLFVAEMKPPSPLIVQIHTHPPEVYVRKRLRVCSSRSLKTLKNIVMSVEFRAEDTHVHIRWSTIS